jgi:hypothetical protein
VDSSELDALLTPEALRLLAELEPPGAKEDVMTMVSRLRGAGHPHERVHAVMNQLALRPKAREKFGEFADRLLLTPEGLEQATRLEVASHHAGRFAHAGIKSVADAGCGIGGDSLAFAGLGLEVVAIERDTSTAAVAAYNLAPWDSVRVVNADATEVDLSQVDALWIDPARREGSLRLTDPDQWSPSLTWVFEVATTMPTGIKLAPGMDRDLIPPWAEAQWVSHQGTVVEMILWSGVLARTGVTRSALVMNSRGTQEMIAPSDSPDVEVGALGPYLYEPDGAVIRARLIGDLARSLSATMLDSTIAYFSSAEAHHTPLAQGFEVIDEVPYSAANLKALVAGANLGQVEIKKRGLDVDPAQVRRGLTLEGTGSATVILTRIQGAKTAILAKRIT